jgi:tetratricopeptide (TPR) repeat protein
METDMKRTALPLFLLIGSLLLAAPARAQQAAPEATAAPDALTPQQVLALAQKAQADAANANNNAINVVNTANNAVNTVNLLLNLVQAASLFGTVLAGAFALLGARIGRRTLADYRAELDKAYAELQERRTGLDAETEKVRIQADKAIRALALMQLGEQQWERRNIKGALQMYRQAYELDPDNRATNYFLGELYIQEKQLDKSVEHLERSLVSGYEYAPAEAALGFALRRQGEQTQEPARRDQLFAQAEERFLKALRLDPGALDINGESVQAALGALYKRQGRDDKAIYRYEQARRITPERSYPVSNLANLYFLQGNLEKAREMFEQSLNMATQLLEANPQDFWPRLDHMTALMVLGHYEEAAEDLAVVLQQVSSPGPLETVIGELNRMKTAPRPLRHADEFITRMQAAIQRMKGR